MTQRMLYIYTVCRAQHAASAAAAHSTKHWLILDGDLHSVRLEDVVPVCLCVFERHTRRRVRESQSCLGIHLVTIRRRPCGFRMSCVAKRDNTDTDTHTHTETTTTAARCASLYNHNRKQGDGAAPVDSHQRLKKHTQPAVCVIV